MDISAQWHTKIEIICVLLHAFCNNNGIMNKKFLIGWVVAAVTLLSCEQKKEVAYSEYTSGDGTYSIEVPANMIQRSSAGDLMSFGEDISNLLLIVQRISSEKSIDECIGDKNVTNNIFTYSHFLSSDTASFYKVTRDNDSTWSGYDLYMLKHVNGVSYLINAQSDIFSQSEMIELIKHVYSSVKQIREVEDGAIDAEDA